MGGWVGGGGTGFAQVSTARVIEAQALHRRRLASGLRRGFRVRTRVRVRIRVGVMIEAGVRSGVWIRVWIGVRVRVTVRVWVGVRVRLGLGFGYMLCVGVEVRMGGV